MEFIKLNSSQACAIKKKYVFYNDLEQKLEEAEQNSDVVDGLYP